MQCRALLTACALVVANALYAELPPDCCELDLWSGQGVSIGKILIPELSVMTAFGGSTAEDGSLAVGHHDPDRDGVTFQNIEFSLSANIGRHAYFFTTYAAKIDLDDRWADELEEYYISIGALPWDSRIKLGRFYTHFGFQNRLHPHDFTFVDQYLTAGRLLGEDNVTVLGAEIEAPIFRHLPGGWSDRLVVSFGSVPDSEDEEHEEEAEAAFEAEGAIFQDYLATANYTLTFRASEHSEWKVGGSAGWGKNNFERHTLAYGLHAEYLWKPVSASYGKESQAHEGHSHTERIHHHGEPGEFFRWRTEFIARRFGGVSQGGDDDSAGLENRDAAETSASERLRRNFSDAGFYSAITYGLPTGDVQAHLRGEYVSGLSDTGTKERWRISPALTWHPRAKVPIEIKLQYNFDHSAAFGEEHSVWAQVNLSWGDCCAHDH
jgi:hypothetical protein